MWPSVVVHEHWPVSQRMIVEMGGRPIKRPQLTLRHRHARFDWSHDHLGWTIRTWRQVHWSDESRFLLRPTDGCARVYNPTYSQRKNNPRQLHPHPQKQLCPKCGCSEMKCRCSDNYMACDIARHEPY
jgi:hypothetical protein